MKWPWSKHKETNYQCLVVSPDGEIWTGDQGHFLLMEEVGRLQHNGAHPATMVNVGYVTIGHRDRFLARGREGCVISLSDMTPKQRKALERLGIAQLIEDAYESIVELYDVSLPLRNPDLEVRASFTFLGGVTARRVEQQNV